MGCDIKPDSGNCDSGERPIPEGAELLLGELGQVFAEAGQLGGGGLYSDVVFSWAVVTDVEGDQGLAAGFDGGGQDREVFDGGFASEGYEVSGVGFDCKAAGGFGQKAECREGGGERGHQVSFAFCLHLLRGDYVDQAEFAEL